jgi:hypothetical protein
MVKNLFEEIGYEMKGRINVHYFIPVLTMSRNGLRQIRDEHDISQMVQFVEIGHHFISLYLYHDDSIKAMNWDDILHFPVTKLPPIINPMKPMQIVYADEQEHEEPVPIQVLHPEIAEVK